jgi:hypothetical protein
LPPTTPEGNGFKVNDPTKADDGKILRFDLMWFTGVERSGDEQFTARQSNLANFCAGLLRARNSPSFSVAPNGPSNLDPTPLFYAPATPLNMPGTPPVVVLPGADLTGVSFSRGALLPGRFPFKFVVSSNSQGLPGTDVAVVVDRGSTEFAAPLNLKGNANVAILGTVGFGLNAGDQIDALEKEPPSAVDFFRFGTITPPLNGTLRVYFTSSGLDPNAIYLSKAQWVNNNAFIQRTITQYAQPPQLGLGLGDEISTICVRSTNDVFAAGDLVFFALRANSTLVKNGVIDSASILVATGNGFIEAQTPASLGLKPTDEIRGLKCFAAPRICDINQDGKVNIDDIELIFQARNTPAVPGDPRDVDGDGVITVNDARICTQRCDNPKCAK